MIRSAVIRALWTCAVLLAGCATASEDLVSVTGPDQRLQFSGFSVLPPRGEGWYATSAATPDEVWQTVASFVREAPGQQPGGAIWASVAVANLDVAFQSPEQLMRSIIARRQAELQGGRFRLLQFRSGPGPAAGCQRYDAEVEDRGVPGFPNTVFLLSLHHAICLHPQAPTLAVNLSYSERRPRNQEASPLRTEGEPFLASLQFAQLGRPAVVASVAVKDPQGIAATEQAVWVAELNSNTVARIDPQRNVVVKRYNVGVRPVGLAVGEGAVWVAANGSDEVWTIDLKADEVRGQPIKVPRGPVDVAVGFGSVWVTSSSSGTVTRIDARTRQVVATIPVAAEPIGVAVGRTGVWVAGFKDSLLWRIDPRTNQVAGLPMPVGQGPSAVTTSPHGVWIASQSASVTRVQEAGVGLDTIAIGRSAAGVATVGDEVWVTDYLGGLIWRVNAATGEVLQPPIPVGKQPLRAAVADGAVWVTNVGSGTVARIAGF